MKIPNVEISHTAVDIEYVPMSDSHCNGCGRIENILLKIKRKNFSLDQLLCASRAETMAAAALTLRP